MPKGSHKPSESANLSVKAPIRTIEVADETAMQDLGARLFRLARAGDVIALRGDLGAGKSVLARGFIRKACVHAGEDPENFDVPSPTFTLVQTYEGGNLSVWHFDLYRIEKPAEVWELGFEEALDEGVSLIEWPERAAGLLPDARLDVEIEPREGSDMRMVTLKPGPSWQERITDV